MQVHAFILERPPQAFDNAVLYLATLPVPADFEFHISQYVSPITAGDLRPLVGVVYLRRAIFCQSLFQCFNAKYRIHAVGELPSKNVAAEPVHDRHEI